MHPTFLIPPGHVYVIGAALEPYVVGLFPLKVAKETRCVPNIILEREVVSVAKFDYMVVQIVVPGQTLYLEVSPWRVQNVLYLDKDLPIQPYRDLPWRLAECDDHHGKEDEYYTAPFNHYVTQLNL